MWSIFKNELKLMFVKDPRRALFILGASITYLILFSLLYGPHVVNKLPLVIYDEDQSQLSRSLIQDFADSQRFSIVGFASTQEEMQQYITDKDAFAAVTIPYNFSRNIKNGLSSSALLVVNAANLLIANTASTAAQEIIAHFSQANGAVLAEKTGLMPMQGFNRAGAVKMNLRILNNPTLSYLYFFIFGLAMAALQQGIFLSVGASLITAFNPCQIKASSVPAVMAARLLPYFCGGILAFAFVLYVSINVFNLPCKGSLPDFFLASFTFSFTAVGLGSLFAAFCDNEVTFTKISLIYTVPAFILSGHIWPQYSMNFFTQLFSYTFPLYYFADTVRDLMLNGNSPLIYHNVAVLVFLGLAFIAAAAFILRRKCDSQVANSLSVN